MAQIDKDFLKGKVKLDPVILDMAEEEDATTRGVGKPLGQTKEVKAEKDAKRRPYGRVAKNLKEEWLIKENAAQIFTPENIAEANRVYWASEFKVNLPSNTVYSLLNHEFQLDMFNCTAQNQVWMKGTQIGMSTIAILTNIHGHIFDRYKQGSIYYLPTGNDIVDFTKTKLNPIITLNPETIGKYIGITDSATIKLIGKSPVYFRGTRATRKIENMQSSSTRLKSISSDRNTYDEYDEMDMDMVELAEYRTAHSEVREKLYLGTPTVPGYGVSKKYDESDMRIWMVLCAKCGKETCLEKEFPESLGQRADGYVFRKCRHCGSEVNPSNGRWDAQKPSRSKDLVGFASSQLMTNWVEAKSILKAFHNPPHGNLTLVYNNMLGLPHVTIENRLTTGMVYDCCGMEAMPLSWAHQTAMGVDVGAKLHVIIGFRPAERRWKILKIASVGTWNDVHDLARAFNVSSAVIDVEPELHKARDFQKAEPYVVYLCDYQENIVTSARFTPEEMLVRVNRAEICDQSHQLFAQRRVELPRMSEELKIFALQMTNLAKKQETKKTTGAPIYRYLKLGDDHYRHALNYLILAGENLGVSQDYGFGAQTRQFRTKTADEYMKGW